MNYLSSIVDDDMELDFGSEGSEKADYDMARIIADQEMEPKKDPSRFPRVRYRTAKGINRRGYCVGEVTKGKMTWYRICRRIGDGRVFLRTGPQIEFLSNACP